MQRLNAVPTTPLLRGKNFSFIMKNGCLKTAAQSDSFKKT